MKNIVIYYSEFNIDSQLAALILRETFNDDDASQILDVEMIAYNRSIDFKPPAQFDTVYIVGPVFHSLHLEIIQSINPDALIIIFNVNNDLVYKENILNKVKIISSKIHEEDNTLEFKDLTTLMLDSLELYQPSTSILASEDFKEFSASILKYKRFQVLEDIQELAFVHQGIKLINELIDDNVILDDIPVDTVEFYEDHKYEYNKHVQKIRSIINRNFSLKTLVSGSSMLSAPLLNVSEEHAIAVMRLVSYSYDDVITYEDTATYRLYRIYSIKNKDWLIKCIKPNDCWMEGEILLMKTEIPTHSH